MDAHDEAPYELYYWPGIQGRGEFIRLAFEDVGVPYVDVARKPKHEGGGMSAIMAFLDGKRGGLLPFAPPFLKHGELVVAQTAAILQYLGPRLGLVPQGETAPLAAHQLQLTVADFVAETHDNHHPVAVSLRYDEQKREAARHASFYVRERIPKYLGYFERVLERSGGPFLLGGERSYVDLSLFQLVCGLRYAFPRVMTVVEPRFPRVVSVHDRIAERPRVAAYLASERRLPFNEMGIYRHYPELDTPPS